MPSCSLEQLGQCQCSIAAYGGERCEPVGESRRRRAIRQEMLEKPVFDGLVTKLKAVAVDINCSTRWASHLMRAISWRSEEHTSELHSLMRISYAVFCLKKKKKHIQLNYICKNMNTD